MPFIQMPLGDVKESAPVPEGKYDLQIVKAVEEASKAHREANGEDADPNMLHCTFAIKSDEYPNASLFSSWFMYPEGEDENVDQMRMREINRLLYWFNIPHQPDGFDVDDVEGCEGENVPVGQDVTNTGRTVNTLALEYIPEGGEEETEGAKEEPEEEAVEEEEEIEEEVEEEEAEEEETEPEPQPKRTAKKPAPKPAAKNPVAKPAAKKPAARRR